MKHFALQGLVMLDGDKIFIDSKNVRWQRLLENCHGRIVCPPCAWHWDSQRTDRAPARWAVSGPRGESSRGIPCGKGSQTYQQHHRNACNLVQSLQPLHQSSSESVGPKASQAPQKRAARQRRRTLGTSMYDYDIL